MACDSDQDICNTEHILTQDDHSADSPIVGSFQVPVNLNESSLSLFDTTAYNAKYDYALRHPGDEVHRVTK